MKDKNVFYIYHHETSDTGRVFYIGKGKGKRAYSTYNRSQHWRNIVNKHGLVVKIHCRNMSEEDALDGERFMISLYGRRDIGTGILVNMTDGGEGVSGMVYTDKQKLEMGRRRRGRKHTEETKRKIAHNNSIRPISNETRRKHSENTKMLGWVGEDHPRAKLVFNIETGVFYGCVKDAAISRNLNPGTLRSKLNNRMRNNTPFILV